MMKAQVIIWLASMLMTTVLTSSGRDAISRQQPWKGDGTSFEQKGGIRVMISPVAWSRKDNRYVTKEQFKVGELVRAKVTVVSQEPVNVMLTSSVRQNRPLLMKDGKLVPYRKSFYLNPECIVISVIDMGVLANRPTAVDLFDMADFYGPLEPGEYELTLHRALDSCGTEFYQSDTIRFEVIP